MRILSVHNSYQIRGGEDESRQSEESLLRHHGHEVNTYEISNDLISQISPSKLAARTIWSHETYRDVQKILQSRAYDLVHVQNFFPLISPSVFYAAKSVNIPVLQTLRNYRLICPNALFFRDGEVCEDCLGKAIPYPGVIHSCYRESVAASSVTTGMLVIHRLLKTWKHKIDGYIALTHFARNKFIEAGFPSEKIHVKPNFVRFDPGMGEGKGGYALYVGRLSVEKGLDTLLQAWAKLEAPIPLKIVGDGPLASQVDVASREIGDIEWLGRLPVRDVYELMGNALFLIFPSKWSETFGRVAVEAFAKGTPVVASEIGAIAEIIDAGRTGLLFKPGNPSDLAEKVNRMLQNPTNLQNMRIQSRNTFLKKYTAQENYERLIEIYKSHISK